MTGFLHEKEFSRKTFVKGSGVLIVGFGAAGFAGKVGAADIGAPTRAYPFALNQVDSFLAVHADNTVTLFQSYPNVAGSFTGFLQIAAEELNLDISQINQMLIDSSTTPANGSAAGSGGTQYTGPQIRTAAAYANQTLLQLASASLGVPVANLTVNKGVVSGGGKSTTYGQLLGDKVFNVTVPLGSHPADAFGLAANNAYLAPGEAPAKAMSQYKLVGTRVPRIDIPDMVTGKFTYVHNVRVPGMLHGRVVRPPGQFAYRNGAGTPLAVDENSVKHLQGVQVVRKGDFVGVVAPHEYDAIQAAAQLKVTWQEPAIKLPGSGNIESALRNAATTSVVITQNGDLPTGFAQAAKTVSASYKAPYILHGSLGPNCVIADVTPTSAVIMSSNQSMSGTQSGVAAVLGLPLASVRSIVYGGAGSYGSGGSGDPPLVAAILSQAVGKPVRVQTMRWHEHGWDSFGPAQVVDMRAGVDANGKIVAFDFWEFHQGYAPSGTTVPRALDPGGAWSKAPFSTIVHTSPLTTGGVYVIPNRRVVNNYVPDGYLMSSPMRAPLEMPAVFASEQTIDELAHAVNMDPIAFRRLNMTGNDLWLGVLEAATKAANWQPKVSGSGLSDANIVTGRGFAFSTHEWGNAPTGPGLDFTNRPDTAAATVADIEVNKKTGKIKVTHLYAAMSPGYVINPASVENQIVGQQIMGTSEALVEEVKFTQNSVTSLDWVTYPILRFKDAPKVTPIVVSRPDQRPRGAGEETLPGPAGAIANAFFDATGVRLRQIPMTPATVRGALKAAGVA